MASSGVTLEASAVDIFNEMKLRHKTQYLIFKIDEGQIKLDKKVDQDERPADKTAQNLSKWECFCNELPSDDCRYAVFDFYMEKAQQATGNRVIESLIFVMWNPDSAPIKKKMLYASSKDAIKKTLRGLQAEIQATDLDELTISTVEDKIARGKTM